MMRNLSFTSLLREFLRGVRTFKDTVAAGELVTKDGSVEFSTLNILKISRAAREGVEDKFTSFESDAKLGGYFRVACDLHMRLDALCKSIKSHDMHGMFNVI